MSAFILANVSVSDLSAYASSGYLEAVPKIAAKFGGFYRVRAGAVMQLEGALETHRLVLIEFPDYESAQKFWNSEEYAPWKKVRQNPAKSQIIAIEGLTETVDAD